MRLVRCVSMVYEAEVEDRGCFLIGLSLGQELQNLAFALGQQLVGILHPALSHQPDVILQQRLGDGRREERPADGTERTARSMSSSALSFSKYPRAPASSARKR